MALFGIGTDIVSIARIGRIYERHPRRLPQRILSPFEQDELSRAPNPTAFLAKRFAVKEAAVKALGTGFRDGITFADFSISHGNKGQPRLQCTGQARVIMEALAITSSHVSISDEIEYAVAFVVLERFDNNQGMVT